MIEVAEENITVPGIRFLTGDTEKVLQLDKNEGAFDLIASVMTSQFIENIKDALQNLV
jgi:hypothetical protein